MFYHIEQLYDLPHNPFNALIVPRPIGWISTLGNDGAVNLAPYSFFNAVAYFPPQVMFSAVGTNRHGAHKDTLRNIQETGEFVVNLATWELREQVNLSSIMAPPGVDEFELAGLDREPSVVIRPPRVAQSPAHLECVLTRTVSLPADDPDQPNTVVFGRVVGIHIKDSVMTGGRVDIRKLRPIGRLGYQDYVAVTDTFSMTRPSWPPKP